VQANRQATLVVNLPASATLTVNNTPTSLTSSRRVFTTPPLEPGKAYYYTLRIDVIRDGQKLTATRDVDIRAGQETTVALDVPAADATANR
jgi:uncharacterized protein (TIGR03000 family)